MSSSQNPRPSNGGKPTGATGGGYHKHPCRNYQQEGHPSEYTWVDQKGNLCAHCLVSTFSVPWNHSTLITAPVRAPPTMKVLFAEKFPGERVLTLAAFVFTSRLLEEFLSFVLGANGVSFSSFESLLIVSHCSYPRQNISLKIISIFRGTYKILHANESVKISPSITTAQCVDSVSIRISWPRAAKTVRRSSHRMGSRCCLLSQEA